MTTSRSKKILVIGATGQQGGAAAKQLLNSGWAVRVLVRYPEKSEAQALRKQGAEIVQGDLDYPESIRVALKGAYGVFSVQALHTDDLEREIRHGKLIADAAKAEGISHMVYSSVSGADRGTGITSFENKAEIERYIHLLQLPATILRPVMFMDNVRHILKPVHGKIDFPYMGPPETKVQMIAVHDIGAIATIAFGDPGTYIGKTLEIAGDELTISQMAQTLGTVLDIKVQYEDQPGNGYLSDEHDGSKANAFFEREGYTADIEAVRKLHPQLMSFEAWLHRLTSGNSGRP